MWHENLYLAFFIKFSKVAAIHVVSLHTVMVGLIEWGVYTSGLKRAKSPCMQFPPIMCFGFWCSRYRRIRTLPKVDRKEPSYWVLALSGVCARLKLHCLGGVTSGTDRNWVEMCETWGLQPLSWGSGDLCKAALEYLFVEGWEDWILIIAAYCEADFLRISRRWRFNGGKSVFARRLASYCELI